jgi:cellobiose PTS system EIIC component
VILLAVDLARRRGLPIFVALPVALVFFVLLLPIRGASSLEVFAHTLGSSGLFLAMGAALIAVTALRFARAKLGPALGTGAAAVALAGSALALQLAGISLSARLNEGIAPLGHLGDTLAALLLIMLVQQLLWLVGIHGPALLAPVILPVYLGLQIENTTAMARGDALPHIVVTSFFLFNSPGGSGATLPVVLLLLRSRVARLRTVAYAALVPAIFNVNEPLTLGLPIVLNPILAVPFVLVPLMLGVTTYLAMSWGWVARPAIWILSWVPQPFAVFWATRDWRAVILIVANIALAALVYFPFVRHYERREALRERAASEAV